MRPRGKSGGGSGSVLTWSADDTAGSITQLAHPLHLPALHSLFPVSHTPEGEAEEAAAAAAEERAAAEVDGSGERRGGALAVLAGGGLALCSSGEVVAEAEEARGQHTVAAAYQQGVLVLLTSDARSGAVSSTLCRVQVGALHAPQPPAASRSLARLPACLPTCLPVYLPACPSAVLSAHTSGTLSVQPPCSLPATSLVLLQGGKLECERALQLLPPSTGSRAVAATCTAERTAVLWSDGSVAVYLVPGDKQPLLRGSGQTGDSRQPVAQRRLSGYRLPAGKQKGASGAAASKKRGAAGEADAAAGGVSMAGIGEKQVAVVGWANDSEGEEPFWHLDARCCCHRPLLLLLLLLLLMLQCQ